MEEYALCDALPSHATIVITGLCLCGGMKVHKEIKHLTSAQSYFRHSVIEIQYAVLYVKHVWCTQPNILN